MLNREILQVFLVAILFQGLILVIKRYKKKNAALGLFFWGTLFIAGIAGIIFPELTVYLASIVGIGRGVDFVVYASIVLLYYLIFRLYSRIEDLKSDIVILIREIALMKRVRVIKKNKNDK